MKRDAATFIREHTDEVEPLEKAGALAFWEASLSGKAEDFERVGELEKQLVAIYSRPQEYEEVGELKRACDPQEDPLTARLLNVLYRAYRGTQGDRALLNRIVDLENDLSQEFNTFRATFRGEKCANNALEEILKNTSDSDEAKEAWQALKQVGEIAAPRIVELARMRNRHARNLGATDYYTLSLELHELDIDRLFSQLEQLEDQTAPLYSDMRGELDKRLAREFGIKPSDLRPWHYRNAFFQDMPDPEGLDLDGIFADRDVVALSRAYYDSIGLDVGDILAKSDLYEKDGKDQHAYCIGIDKPHDVRILCNVRPTSRWMSTMLHELGHAVYDHEVSPDLPHHLRGPAHTLTTEAVAMLNERFMQSTGFLEEIVGLSKEKARELANALAEHQRVKLLVFVRWVLVMTHFERALYEDPLQDLSVLWWEMVARFQGLDGEERKDRPDWAAKPHLACAPAYYQNYLLGEMCASQILDRVRQQVAPRGNIVNNRAYGEWMREKLFRPGASSRWDHRLAEATGESLNPGYFVADLQGTS